MANVVQDYSFVFVNNNWVNSAACRPIAVNVATLVLRVIKYTVPALVPELNVAFSVDFCKERFGKSAFHYAADVFFAEKHLGFGAANPAVRTTHKSGIE